MMRPTVTRNPCGFALPLTKPKPVALTASWISTRSSLIFPTTLGDNQSGSRRPRRGDGHRGRASCSVHPQRMQVVQHRLGCGLRRRYRAGEPVTPRVLRERPSLPVVELAEHHIESVETGVNWAGQQIQALGQQGVWRSFLPRPWASLKFTAGRCTGTTASGSDLDR